MDDERLEKIRKEFDRIFTALPERERIIEESKAEREPECDRDIEGCL